MRNTYLLISFLLLTLYVKAQELNCKVIVNGDKIATGNTQVFKTLETSITEFINQSHWTDKNFKPQERIDCSLLITLTEQTNSNSYKGNIQVLSSRPVYNSVYTTPLFSYKDNNLNFSYTEFEPLRFDKNSFQSDLVSVLSYYVYLILAIDADSFALNGGDEYYKMAQQIVDQVDNANDKPGWESSTNKINRYHLINKIISPSNQQYHTTLYEYHIHGLDRMAENKKEGKNTIKESIIALNKIYSNSMSSYIFRIFMDAKADEIVKIFSDGPQTDTQNLISVLNRISPTNAAKWAEIK